MDKQNIKDIKDIILYGLAIASCIAVIYFGVFDKEPVQQDVFITTPTPIVNVEPAEVIVVIEKQPVTASTYEDITYLLEADVNRMIYNSDRRQWDKKTIEITQVSDLVWDVTVTYVNGATDTFTFNERFGWH